MTQVQITTSSSGDRLGMSKRTRAWLSERLLERIGFAQFAPCQVRRVRYKRKIIQQSGSQLISTITNRGEIVVQIVKGTFNTERIVEFRERLAASAASKLLLVVDNLRGHRAKLFQTWIEQPGRRSRCSTCRSMSPCPVRMNTSFLRMLPGERI
ncbi:hypothetical protein GO613_06690 [Azoarcus communis]|nr:hypothetical protein [Parazoarcus communis]